MRKNIESKFDFINHRIKIFVVLKLMMNVLYVLFFITFDRRSNVGRFRHQHAVHYNLFLCLFINFARTIWMIEFWHFAFLQKLGKFNFFHLYLRYKRVFYFYKINVSFHIFCLMILFASMSIWIIAVDKSFNKVFNYSWISFTKILFKTTSFCDAHFIFSFSLKWISPTACSFWKQSVWLLFAKWFVLYTSFFPRLMSNEFWRSFHNDFADETSFYRKRYVFDSFNSCCAIAFWPLFAIYSIVLLIKMFVFLFLTRELI